MKHSSTHAVRKRLSHSQSLIVSHSHNSNTQRQTNHRNKSNLPKSKLCGDSGDWRRRVAKPDSRIRRRWTPTPLSTDYSRPPQSTLHRLQTKFAFASRTVARPPLLSSLGFNCDFGEKMKWNWILLAFGLGKRVWNWANCFGPVLVEAQLFFKNTHPARPTQRRLLRQKPQLLFQSSISDSNQLRQASTEAQNSSDSS